MFSRLAILMVFFAAPLAAQAASGAAPEQPQSILASRADDAVAVMRGEQTAEDVFAGSFLAAVPAEQLAAINAQLVSQFGAIKGVESVEPQGPGLANIVLRFEKALGKGVLSVEAELPHKINGLRLTSFDALDDSLIKIRAELEALPGDVGVLFTKLGGDTEPALSINADRQFAIGSTFKLYILSALARSIEQGERNWSDVVILNRRSFPSGQMQDWPEGAPVTLHTLAAMMISISDNTATDMLLHEVGREAVEAELRASGHSNPDRTLPFLSTLELFALKGSEGNMRKYEQANEAGRRFILTDFEDDIGGDADKVTPPRFIKPTAIDTLEWFASARDLQKLAERLTEIPDPAARRIMAVNTALPKAMEEQWSYVGYKGGSEPGVLNLTWVLQDQAGEWHFLAMSWNDPEAAVDNSAFELLSQRILSHAR